MKEVGGARRTAVCRIYTITRNRARTANTLPSKHDVLLAPMREDKKSRSRKAPPTKQLRKTKACRQRICLLAHLALRETPPQTTNRTRPRPREEALSADGAKNAPAPISPISLHAP